MKRALGATLAAGNRVHSGVTMGDTAAGLPSRRATRQVSWRAHGVLVAFRRPVASSMTLGDTAGMFSGRDDISGCSDRVSLRRVSAGFGLSDVAGARRCVSEAMQW